mgnify:CR=1 FL=1
MVAVWIFVDLSSKSFEEILFVVLSVLTLRSYGYYANFLMKITKCWTSWHLSQFLKVLMSLFQKVINAFGLGFTSNILSLRFWYVHLGLISRWCESLIHSWHANCFIQLVLMLLPLSSFCYCNLFFLSLFRCDDLWFYRLDCVLASKPLI